MGHLNQTIFPHNRSLQGAIATWMRPFACSQTPTGVGLCAPTGVAATRQARTRATMRRDVFMSDISHYKRVIGDALHSRSEGGRRPRWTEDNRGVGQIRTWILAALAQLGIQPNDLPPDLF